MIVTIANIAACQEALYLLRQDAALPTVETAAADTSLEWKKCQRAFDTAIHEVWSAHDWNETLKLTGADLDAAPGDCTNWTPEMLNALTYCIARELAIPLAGRIQDLKNWDALYGTKLTVARAYALEAARAADGDALHKEILQLLVPEFQPAGRLPRSVKSITDRIEALKESARLHVVSDHAWNFAREKSPAVSCHVPHEAGHYPFAAELPGDCAHLEAVFTDCGETNEWRIFGKSICAMQPIRGISYVRDMKRLDKWNPLVYRVFVFRLAADVSTTVAPDLTVLMEQRYAQALAEAKCRDARESNTPTDAWGRNFYVDAMQGRGRLDPRPRLPRHSFHGLV